MNLKLPKLPVPAWVGWLLLSFAALLIILTIGRLVYLEPWLQSKLENTVREKSQGLYQARVQKLKVSILGGSLTLDSLVLQPDIKLWEKRRQQVQVPPVLARLTTPRLELTGINFWQLLRGKPLRLGTIQLKQPIMVLTRMPVKAPPGKPLYQQLTGMFKNMQINQLGITQGNFTLKKHNHTTSDIALQGLSVQANALWYDSSAYVQPDRVYYAKSIWLSARQSNVLLPGENYRVKSGSINLNTRNSLATLQKVQVIPLYTSGQLARRQGGATPSIRINIPAIRVSRLNCAAYSQSEAFVIGEIAFNNPQLYAFMDSKHYMPQGKKPLLPDLVSSIPNRLQVRRAHIKGMQFRYEELAPRAIKKGYLTLTHLNVTITNISNDKKQMSRKNPAIIKGSMRIMGKAPLTATIRVNLLDPTGYHTVQGTLGKANPQDINPIIEPAYYVRVRSGQIHKGHFSMALNNNRATGSMHLEYNNFKVDLLSKEKPAKKDAEKAAEPNKKKQSLGKKLLSLFANKVILNTHNNPEKDGLLGVAGFKTGKINTARRPNRSLFTYWIDGLASGVRSTLGLPSQIPEQTKL